jgi:hypothetical protein
VDSKIGLLLPVKAGLRWDPFSGRGEALWDRREQWSVSLSLRSDPIPRGKYVYFKYSQEHQFSIFFFYYFTIYNIYNTVIYTAEHRNVFLTSEDE